MKLASFPSRRAFPELALSAAFVVVFLLNGALMDRLPLFAATQPAAPGVPSRKTLVLPKGVTELKFADFFVYPVGPAGLTLTETLKNLDGKRVRILGCMVQQENKRPGTFLLAPTPIQLHEEHYGFADDLPASTLFVSDPANHDVVQYKPGLIQVSGTLSVGNREESDGRISLVRLTLDPPKSVTRRNSSSGKGGASELLQQRESTKPLRQ